ncbi:MAG TPA: hypothetical protein PK802_03700 [Candidatus Cloacimonadota bacterium]|jgi:hypothetical protein|nr:hypothetical protein [Candidatus Cloacimonadota bacterium]HOC95443.1 hypothetical protein [Candidatus Cloacimonadota bacterium]HOG31485.1 hypothetical protein [Candidatus Cloacimonadota bacterium]HOR59481.1 hypothetical protein [Candidatus Cloacimonadota bacterium]HPB08777.1 hypothetical protein [Candidatus Cloacimonadota bacterium]
MTNSTRNTIVLLVILLLGLAYLIFQGNRMGTKIAELEQTNKLSQAQIDSLNTLLETRDELERQYRFYEALSEQQSKLILGMDSPTITYRYLLSILNWMGTNVNFDFAANESEKADQNFHQYVLSGRSYYPSLLHLISQLEQQRAVLTLEDLTIGSENLAQSDTVSFSLVLQTYFAPGGAEPFSLTFKKTEKPYTGYQLFNTQVASEILPRDIDPNLLDTDQARLIGISRGIAFFRNEKGIIRILTEGDPVAYGYLYSVDEAAKKVVFRLNKYGLEEDYTIFINKSR